MTIFNQPMRTAAVFAAAVALVFLGGCTKDASSPSGNADHGSQEVSPIKDKVSQQRIDEVMADFPGIAVYNENADKYILIDFDSDRPKFDFASPSGGWTFSGPGGSIQFVEGPDGGFYQIVTPGSLGGGGGTVAAGPFTLDLDYVLCFNSGDDETDDIFGFGGFGISGALGIAGDFEALMSGEIDLDADPSMYIEGVVEYIVYDGTAQGSYPVLNFFDVDQDLIDPENKAVAVFAAYQGSGGVFFSKSGEVTFNGSSATFSGTYWGITDFLFFDDDIDPDLNYVEVAGAGTITCE